MSPCNDKPLLSMNLSVNNISTIPVCPRKPKQLIYHGSSNDDPYYWLREKQQPEVIDYLEAENAYTEATLIKTKSLQAKLYDEFLGRIQETDISAPLKKGNAPKRKFIMIFNLDEVILIFSFPYTMIYFSCYYIMFLGNYIYYQRTEKGKQYPIYCRKSMVLPDSNEEILVDLNLYHDHDFVQMGIYKVSPNQKVHLEQNNGYPEF